MTKNNQSEPDTARDSKMTILPISVSLLADQLPRIFLIFSIFSVKLLTILTGQDVENQTPKA